MVKDFLMNRIKIIINEKPDSDRRDPELEL